MAPPETAVLVRRLAAAIAAFVLAPAALACVTAATGDAAHAAATGGTVHAATPRTPDRLDTVAAALRKDPLFVDPELSSVLDAAGRASVEAKLRSSKFPLYVIVIPLNTADESGGDPQEFAYKLYRRSGLRGEYVVANQYGDAETLGIGVPIDASDVNSRLLDSNLLFSSAPLAQNLPKILSVILQARAAPPTIPAEPNRPSPYSQGPRGDSQIVSAFIGAFAASAVTAALLALIAWALIAGVARRRAPGPRALARLAAREVGRLRSALAQAPDGKGHDWAFSALDAAELLRTDHRGGDPAELVAAVVLARDGQAVLAGHRPVQPCFVNPLHGRSARNAEVSLPGLPQASRPLCRACAAATSRRRAASVLRLRTGRSRTPYYALPGPWHGGYSHQDDLPQRVREFLGVKD